MMSQQRRTTYLTSVSALLLSLLVGVFLFARRRFSKPTPATTATSHSAETSPQDALAYWTTDKKRDAEATPLPIVNEPKRRKRPSPTSRPQQN